MRVPFVDLQAQYASIEDEIQAAMTDVVESSSFIGGPHVRAFEEEFARYIGTPNCVGVGNGTDAIYIALRALGIGSGDEVITAANSFIATSEAITLTGARVVFVDCDPDTYALDPARVAAAITPRTRAIVPVHLYGHPAPMAELMQMAREHDLRVVEDAAQAHGAELDGQRAGTFGDAATFSFYPGKNLGAYGDAGAIVTADPELTRHMRMLANHGRSAKYDHEFEGVNSRLDAIQAAVLSVKLRHIEEWTEQRIRAAARYNENLAGTGIRPPVVRPGARHVYHLYVVQVDDRDQVRARLKERGIATGVHYPLALPRLAAYSHMGLDPSEFPVAIRNAGRILSLPMFPEITDDQIDHVCEELCALAVPVG